MKQIVRYSFLIILAVMTAALAACAAEPETVTVIETVEVEKEVKVIETVEVEKEVVVVATPEVAAPADVEQTLVLASGRNLGPANPHDYSSSFVILDLLYEPLVRYGQDGTIEPALAESWEISEDGLTWTFALRQDVTFHDDTPFNAEAVKWNMDRWVGNDRHNWLPTTSRISSVEATDEFTVVLTLNQPYYPAMQDLTLVRPVRFLSTEAVDAAGEFAEAIGTGPWQIESISDNQAVLVRNESYWGEKPALEKLVLEVILDPQTRIAALLSGEVDVIGGEYLGGISLESLPVLERNEDINILNGDSLVSLYISTQFQQPPFDDVRVRQALNMAIDRAGMNTALFGGKGEAAQNLMPSNIPYVTFTDTDLYEYDPEKAAALLAEAGWTLNADGILEKDGELMQIDLVVDQASRPETATMGEVIQAQFKELGIELEIRAFDYSGWLDVFYAEDYDLLMRFSWGPPYDPHSLLTGAFSSTSGEGNTTAYSDPVLDELINTALASTDEAERQEIYNEIWQRLDDEAAVIPLVYPQRVYAVRSGVEGFLLGGTEYDSARSVQDVVITND
ncbi:MAG: nickel ABC transporter substrate-binding protein [Chloroflexota bacterium]